MTSQENRRRYAMLNKVMVIGRLIKDAEVRYLDSTSGSGPLQLTTFAIALDGAANYGQDAAFLDFSHLGDFAVAEHLLKGRLVYIEGHITQQRKEIEGQKRTFTNFQCDRLQLLSARPANEQGETIDDEEDDLPLPAVPKTISAHSLLTQTLVNRYGALDSWSGKQVANFVRWLKDRSGVDAPQLSLDGLQQQIALLTSAQAQAINDDLNRALATKSA